VAAVLSSDRVEVGPLWRLLRASRTRPGRSGAWQPPAPCWLETYRRTWGGKWLAARVRGPWRRGARSADAAGQLRVWRQTPTSALITSNLTAPCCLGRPLSPPPGLLQPGAVVLLSAGPTSFSPEAPSQRGAARRVGCTTPATHRPSAPPTATLGLSHGCVAALGSPWGLGGMPASTVSGPSPPHAHALCTSEPTSPPFPAGMGPALTLGAVAGAPPASKGTQLSTLRGRHFLRRIGQKAAAALWAESAAPAEVYGVKDA
jgi:hypothetical protein